MLRRYQAGWLPNMRLNLLPTWHVFLVFSLDMFLCLHFLTNHFGRCHAEGTQLLLLHPAVHWDINRISHMHKEIKPISKLWQNIHNRSGTFITQVVGWLHNAWSLQISWNWLHIIPQYWLSRMQMMGDINSTLECWNWPVWVEILCEWGCLSQKQHSPCLHCMPSFS